MDPEMMFFLAVLWYAAWIGWRVLRGPKQRAPLSHEEEIVVAEFRARRNKYTWFAAGPMMIYLFALVLLHFHEGEAAETLLGIDVSLWHFGFAILVIWFIISTFLWYRCPNCGSVPMNWMGGGKRVDLSPETCPKCAAPLK
jgi:hypothetical protein